MASISKGEVKQRIWKFFQEVKTPALPGQLKEETVAVSWISQVGQSSYPIVKLEIWLLLAVLKSITRWAQLMLENAHSDLLGLIRSTGIFPLMNTKNQVASSFQFPLKLMVPQSIKFFEMHPDSHQKHSNISIWWEPKPGCEPSQPLVAYLFGSLKQ